MNHIDLLKIIWTSVYDPSVDAFKIVEKYFHPKYEQCINGIIMNREEYITHLIEQKNNIFIDTIDYKHYLENGNELFALYYPKGRKKNNSPIEAEVIAYFLFEKNQILKVYGQVRLIKGEYADVDMTNS